MCTFYCEKSRDNHYENFKNDGNKSVVKLPEENHIKFSNHKRKLRVPFAIYADCESILKKVEEKRGTSTTVYQKHEAFSFAFKIVSQFDEFYQENPSANQVFMFKGEDCADKFLASLKEWQDKLVEFMKQNKPIIKTEEDIKRHEESKKCHICERDLGEDKVEDHCHITGKYRGPAHNSCNINFNYKNVEIPVVFHNLRKYDSHFIIPKLGNHFKKIKPLAKNLYEFISFQCERYRFIDSFAFLAVSLSKLSSKLGKNKFIETRKVHPDNEKFELVTKKGIYPYDYCKSAEVFAEDRLPSKENFFSSLSNEHISDEDYEHGKKVWNTFGCKTLMDYHDLYLITDVLLLADVMENFRTLSMKDYDLDPFYYNTLPGYSWDACLCMNDKNAIKKNEEVKLELIKDMTMYEQIENNIRGGMSIIMNRYSKANNKYMKDHDKSKDSVYIWYIDANNLYGWSMSQPLPYDGYDWYKIDWTVEEILSLPDDGKEGYIFEVDLKYPESLHDKHRYYPLAPEKIVVTEEMMSDYSKDIKKKLELSESKVEKLVPNLNDKVKYSVHYRNLKFYIQQGLVLTKIHSCIKFNQKPWMKDYIDTNTKKRSQPGISAFEKDLYKLMNNSIFGKSMENVRNRVNVDIVKTEEQFAKLVRDPLLKGWHHLDYTDDNTAVAVHREKSKVVLNKPIACGFSILDLSKLLMYDFYYNTLKPIYGDKIKVNMTDTDSLLLEIETEDLYEDMKLFKDKLDLSEYPKDHKLYDPTNNKVIGKFKDETHGIPISEFVGLRSKMYSFKLDNNKSKQTAKGVKKLCVEQNIKHEDYKRCILGQTKEDMKQTAEFNLIRHIKYQLTSIKVSKSSLVAYDDKTYLLNNIECLPHGHKSIRKNI